MIVISADEYYLNDFRDVEEALVVQHAVNVILAFLVLYPSLAGLFVFGLQFV